jgi:hypothetical protein
MKGLLTQEAAASFYYCSKGIIDAPHRVPFDRIRLSPQRQRMIEQADDVCTDCLPSLCFRGRHDAQLSNVVFVTGPEVESVRSSQDPQVQSGATARNRWQHVKASLKSLSQKCLGC